MANDATIKIDLATEFTGKKAFTTAEKATQKLTKGVKSLAGAFGLAFGARAIGMYAKSAVNAFAADEKAARSLALQLKNTGNSWAGPQVENFIANLQKTTGILDDQLRPAFQTLLTATGDVALAQQALNVALDVSAGTSKDLGSVTTALSKGYLGQTTALSKLGVKLDKATLASGDMKKITDSLTTAYKGQALEAVKGYSGQMALLAVAAADSKEIIGKGLLTAINNLGGNTGISETTKQMENLAQFTSDFIVGLSLIGKIKGSKTGILGMIAGTLGDVIKYGPIGQIAAKGAASQAKPGYGSSNTLENFVQAGGKLTTVTKKLTAAQLLALQTANAKAKADKDAAALEELKKKFDVERINLSTALANAATDEERARIASKIAILDGDAKAAASLNRLSSAQIFTADQMYYLAVQAGDAAAMLKYLATGSGSGGAVYGPSGGGIGNTNLPTASGNGNSAIDTLVAAVGSTAQGGIGGLTINQYVEGGLVDGERIVELVQESLQVLNARGWSQFKTGQLQVL